MERKVEAVGNTALAYSAILIASVKETSLKLTPSTRYESLKYERSEGPCECICKVLGPAASSVQALEAASGTNALQARHSCLKLMIDFEGHGLRLS